MNILLKAIITATIEQSTDIGNGIRARYTGLSVYTAELGYGKCSLNLLADDASRLLTPAELVHIARMLTKYDKS